MTLSVFPLFWVFCVFTLVCEIGPAQGQVQKAEGEAAKETALGTVLASQVRRQTTPLQLADVDSYIQSLVDKLADNAPDARRTWTCLVIKDHQGGSTHEPLSLPGGYLFIPAQLILAAESEGELAGMLAHSMAHVIERHAFHQATHGEIAQLANVPVIFMGGPAVRGGDDENLLVSAAFLEVQRQQELDADGGAVEMMAAAGYDPQALLSYIRRVQAQTPSRKQPFSSLPPRSVRIAHLEQTIEGSQGASPFLLDRSSFHSVQDQVRNNVSRVSMPGGTRRIPSLLHPDQ